jgi:lysyl-tRNA synthetase class 2
VKTTIHEFIEKYTPITEKGLWLEEEITLGARVTNIRHQGKKLVFYDLKQEGEKLQVMCNTANYKGAREFE